ncbi:C50 carotenoid epsilon cyclase [Paenibacillus sp. LC231]|uniref:cache domain-containing sensor histidine kinase n=1 Tax=Paenibacillus sp. LC231 TaxID=1120679 RepID=UPI0008DD3A27|nr:sensor histidine kinase [Paenibacillus sp. LC231]OIB02900.1 C50 carotenoid epsilon cyclase [Paenibacillus sp. LC231]
MMAPQRIKSIQSRIASSFVMLVLFTALLLIFISYRLSESAVRETAESYTSELINQVNANIQTYITGMKDISLATMNNPNVREYLVSADELQPAELAILKAKISEYFHSIRVSRKDIASINIFGAGGSFISDRAEAEPNPYIVLSEQPWYRQAKENKGQTVISSSHVQPVIKGEYRWVVSLSRELSGMNSSNGLGILLIDLNFKVINDMLSKLDLGNRGYVFVIDRQGRIVYHPQQQLLYSNLKTERLEQVLQDKQGGFVVKEGGASRIYSIKDTDFGWKIVGVFYENELVDNKKQMQLSFAIAGVLCLGVGVLFSVVISRNLTRPIKKLQDKMMEVEKGNFDIRVPVGHSREISGLARSFNVMVLKVKELMDQIVIEQEIKRKSELNALQAQINPHFLYNTLDSIIWMAESKKHDEVILMTSALARLFRASLSKGREMIPIATEVEHITNYLKIQQMRYQDKIRFTLDMDRELYPYLTLKVLLQPLVENAIYHGIKNKEGPGTITITGRLQDDRIRFQVMDDGIGMDRSKVETLLISTGSQHSRNSVGIANVHQRIQLYFGAEYGLSYTSEPGAGTIVTVLIPAVHPDEWRSMKGEVP